MIMDVTLERGLPPAQVIQAKEQPGEAGGANSIEKKLLELLRKFKKQQAKGEDLETVQRQIAELLVLGNGQLLDHHDENSILKEVEEICFHFYIFDEASLTKFAEILVESIKELERPDLSKLVDGKKQFTKEELVEIVSKLPSNVQEKLLEELRSLWSEFLKEPVVKRQSEFESSDDNFSPPWSKQISKKMNHLSKEEKAEALQLMNRACKKYVQELKKEENTKLLSELKENFNYICTYYSGDQILISINKLKLLPTKTVRAILKKLDAMLASNKDYVRNSKQSKEAFDSSVELFDKEYSDSLKSIEKYFLYLDKAQLEKFSYVVVEEAKKYNDEDLIMLLRSKTKFDTQSLMAIIAKLPLQKLIELYGKIVDIQSGAQPRFMVRGQADNDANDGGPRRWTDQLTGWLHGLDNKKRREAFAWVRKSMQDCIQQTEGGNHNIDRRLEPDSLSYRYKRILVGRGSNVETTVQLLKLLPRSTVIKLLERLDNEFFNPANRSSIVQKFLETKNVALDKSLHVYEGVLSHDDINKVNLGIFALGGSKPKLTANDLKKISAAYKVYEKVVKYTLEGDKFLQMNNELKQRLKEEIPLIIAGSKSREDMIPRLHDVYAQYVGGSTNRTLSVTRTFLSLSDFYSQLKGFSIGFSF